MINLEKGFTPKLSDSEKLESIKSQRESIKKILADLDKREVEIKTGKMKEFPDETLSV